MLKYYLKAALERATFQNLPGNTFKGEIPDFDGLSATGDTLDACRANLEVALEDWVLTALQLDFPLPDVGIPMS